MDHSQVPIVECIKVAEIRRRSSGSLDSLQDWLDADDRHMYIGRDMSIYVPGSKKSKWHNPYPAKKYSTEESLRLFRKHIMSSGLIHEIGELRGKVLGCWCKEGPCHGKVLVDLYREYHMPNIQVKVYTSKTKKGKNVRRYVFYRNASDLPTWKDLLTDLRNRNDTPLVQKFVAVLKNCPFTSYYFEAPNLKSINIPLEFVLVESDTLHTKKANWGPYRDYMSLGKHATSFDNKDGEFRLIIPTKKGDYGHVADFMKSATDKEIQEVLHLTAKEIHDASKSRKPLYLSTHGDGVSWLHFRVGRTPKYYNYHKYE